jgi:hypothetical protein
MADYVVARSQIEQPVDVCGGLSQLVQRDNADNDQYALAIPCKAATPPRPRLAAAPSRARKTSRTVAAPTVALAFGQSIPGDVAARTRYSEPVRANSARRNASRIASSEVSL